MKNSAIHWKWNKVGKKEIFCWRLLSKPNVHTNRSRRLAVKMSSQAAPGARASLFTNSGAKSLIDGIFAYYLGMYFSTLEFDKLCYVICAKIIIQTYAQLAQCMDDHFCRVLIYFSWNTIQKLGNWMQWILGDQMSWWYIIRHLKGKFKILFRHKS